MSKIITHPHDPHFMVIRDINGCSPSPALSIWDAQHTCVKEEIGLPKEMTDERKAAIAIIENQLKVEHWSVLRFAFVKFKIIGFPHDTIMQMCRHQDSAHLVQSGRYTCDRFIKVADAEIFPNLAEIVEEVFYFLPTGTKHSRDGKSGEYTDDMRHSDIVDAVFACRKYKRAIESGICKEDARRKLPMGIRQDYALACDLEALFHWWDQRTKKDAQDVVRILADMTILACKDWIPEFVEFYVQTRYSKARLAP